MTTVRGLTGLYAALTIALVSKRALAEAPSRPRAADDTPSAEPPRSAPRLIDYDVNKQPVYGEGESNSGQRTMGYVVGATGLLALSVGTYFGVQSFSENRADAARTDALIGGAGVGAGLVAIGLGAYWLLSAPSSSAPSSARSLLVLPMLGSAWSGVVMRGNY